MTHDLQTLIEHEEETEEGLENDMMFNRGRKRDNEHISGVIK